MMHKLSIGMIVVAILFGCNQDDGPKLPSVEERTQKAIDDLKDLLVAPSNGWRVAYTPTNETGVFFMLLDFNTDGTVRIQSDVIDNGGEFRDDTITYRIDSGQGLELILETYGVFHYLFEISQNTFGAEFEFVFVEEDGSDLIFKSKTDRGEDVTILTFESADGEDANLITTEASITLNQGIFQQEDLAGIGGVGNYNFYIPATDHTISITFDLQRRKLKLLGIAKGQDMASIIAANSIVSIDRETSFRLANEAVILTESAGFTFDGTNYVIDQIPIGSPIAGMDSFCTGQQRSTVTFSGSGSFGSFTASSSMFQVYNGFQPKADDLWGVQPFFIYDENDSSIFEDIEAVFPDVVAFQWYHGFELAEDSLLTGMGWVTVDEFSNAEFYLRGYDYVQNGNHFQLSFNGVDFITNENATQQQLDGLDQLTDQIFAGGNIYMTELVSFGGLYEFYNPCNNYKGFIFP